MTGSAFLSAAMLRAPTLPIARLPLFLTYVMVVTHDAQILTISQVIVAEIPTTLTPVPTREISLRSP